MASGLLLCEDLLFISRVTGTAQALGLTIHAVRTPEALIERAEQTQPACVLLDLHHPGLDVAAVLARLQTRCSPPPRVVGYGSHVDVETLRAARQAGCDPVWPRSKFVAELPTVLPEWLAEPSQ
jgi:CheY-like chemotaxis protein